MQILIQSSIPDLKLLSRGKVRDIYEVSSDTLLIITTDRMSAFDVVLPDPIPFKGVVLNQITLFWMEKMRNVVANHLLASDIADFPSSLHPYAEQVEGRAVLVRKAAPLPVECIVRGYITGSGWKDYQNTGMVCGHRLPPNLQDSQELIPPLFTPSTKADVGQHDENISVTKAAEMIGDDRFAEVERISLEIYSQAREYAKGLGIIIADTKFEFGLVGDELLLIDEVLTPDSSRFWPQDGYQPGKPQPSFDKQYLRDWLTQSGWNKKAPAPNLPSDVVEQTKNRYVDAYAMLTGKKLTLP
ncbi:phosphoribosylaminoimidazole-succinocarboxamide synthase [Desulfonatronum thiosulfatophilum]|uniref:Phosphoribosylaminoimidazole-succinocarboxamide synthase n=1 Tax=Desulfonatronum thiosulfatophilum TaxID=617002 RepID=A0A1G6EN24_9BACT|nr:phosphoribosylaminoimidazolesuccinocarboxamide synthase [Desulfonatronum thiosulfatophilum]SDB58923.1 phosphoribosylaminoimidazole-succinocarboxamide synthase [Desulfonatronum thiosulfatophilum]